jgi:hypothetical protein
LITLDELNPEETLAPDPEFMRPPDSDDEMVDEDYTNPDATFLKTGKRKPYAVQYQNKVKEILTTTWKILITNPPTVPDAAAIIMHGSDLSRAAGDWAASDARVRKAIDFIAGGTENPALAFAAAALPMALQMLRNHEPSAEVEPRRIRIPFTKKHLRIKFRIKLGKKLRNLTNDPRAFTAHVLSNPEIQAELLKQGIKVG